MFCVKSVHFQQLALLEFVATLKSKGMCSVLRGFYAFSTVSTTDVSFYVEFKRNV